MIFDNISFFKFVFGLFSYILYGVVAYILGHYIAYVQNEKNT